ncbi:TetR family transcriptional regulator [Rhodococcus wratislaviensis]|uniref:TetR family transcriptional regulator n=3 Tax=Rhodococcus wratislaviensis TaxID=44752 RepID=A0AB38F712_RHOWR|nr:MULTISPECIES: TetR/AcrR family transcriptional regulator [Rhodococcus]REE70722.1 TetR family transcriptional regulator [Rhodococcus wratislaviensis]WAM14796.1 TetR/AcrR family transcriptional regulator [Rhodococcus sp. JS3073]GAF45298.1 hypothetical protein RW1_019_00500 [Rhodococcus wratislaviensis NBRC 100605]SPZ34916.1 TetR family transcriptional regulator [Rhodococcus wratislaviensis]
MTQNNGDTSTSGPSGAGATNRARRPKDRRATIGRVAADLFAEHGYAGTGLADIAEHVGITPGALYRHFTGGKEDILRSIVSTCMDAFIAAIGELPDPPAEHTRTETRLSKPIRNAVSLAQSQSAQVAITLREWHSLSDTAQQELRQKERHLAQLWEDALRNAGPGPGTSPTEAAVRRRALNGALANLARSKTSLAPTRVEDLFTNSLLALVLTPIDQPPAFVEPTRPSDWLPPRSRRQEIRDTSASLFRMYGYHGVGIDDIGKAAGISGPTVYGTYSSKADILVDACDYASGKIACALDAAFASARSADEALVHIVRAYAETVFDNADIISVLNRESDALPDSDRARISRHRSDYRQVCVAVITQVRPDLNDEEASMLLGAVINAIQEIGLMRRGRPTAHTTGDLALKFLLADRASDAHPLAALPGAN